jgi:tetratricopeptide (TPR) repeat protein
MLGLVWTGQVIGDDVILLDGTVHSGVQVTAETLAEVKFTDKGAERSVKPGTKVRSILRDDTSEALDNASGFLNVGRYENAIDEFNVVVSSASGWMAEYGYYGLGRARLMLGLRNGDQAVLRQAIESLDRVKGVNNQSRFLLDVASLKGLCLRQLKDFDGARRAYADLRAIAASASIGDGWSERAAIGLGWTELESGNSAAAVTSFDAAAGASRSWPEVYREALSGWSEALTAAGRSEEILGRLESLESGADRAMQGVIHNCRGLAMYAAKKYVEARTEFVQVVSIYFSDPDQHARALYYCARCYAALGEEEYAGVYRRELRTSYPLSTWRMRLQ